MEFKASRVLKVFLYPLLLVLGIIVTAGLYVAYRSYADRSSAENYCQQVELSEDISKLQIQAMEQYPKKILIISDGEVSQAFSKYSDFRDAQFNSFSGEIWFTFQSGAPSSEACIVKIENGKAVNKRVTFQ